MADSKQETDNAAPETFDPKEAIQPFDWDNLYSQFEGEMSQLEQAEQKLFDDLTKLNAYFNIWARTMHEYDAERAKKRLKTRVARVKVSEDELEDKRVHYIKVVEAFQSALQLLNT
ncbi:hypothetical protein BT63DRAFT_419818 [Microthyrium microscopicum]|uniref:Uncharacterized protein n=1 Tax=Microthyrium microscopicum TaxID=703497 RepID=A0A6A6USS0_9PEZI|nr:hypothetical protein BT63DRAFT_419818 [Microthyrium microscopicum]